MNLATNLLQDLLGCGLGCRMTHLHERLAPADLGGVEVRPFVRACSHARRPAQDAQILTGRP